MRAAGPFCDHCRTQGHTAHAHEDAAEASRIAALHEQRGDATMARAWRSVASLLNARAARQKGQHA